MVAYTWELSGRLRQENLKFELSLGDSNLDLVFKKKRNKKEKKTPGFGCRDKG